MEKAITEDIEISPIKGVKSRAGFVNFDPRVTDYYVTRRDGNIIVTTPMCLNAIHPLRNELGPSCMIDIPINDMIFAAIHGAASRKATHEYDMGEDSDPESKLKLFETLFKSWYVKVTCDVIYDGTVTPGRLGEFQITNPVMTVPCKMYPTTCEDISK